jgi:hypothetical protein
LARRLGSGELTFEHFDAATRPLKERTEKLTAEREALLKAGAGQSAEPRDIEEMARVWENATADERRFFVKRAFPYGLKVFPALTTHLVVSDRVRPIVAD